MSFTNRSGTNLNRRKLKIVSQSANEIIADIERADNITNGNAGTQLNSTFFQAFQDDIDLAKSDAATALSTANSASANATRALNQVLNSQGTVVTVNGTSVNTYEMNNKASLNDVYPIGTIYLTIADASPASMFGGSWTMLSEGKALWTTETSNTGGNTISSGLPNIVGTLLSPLYDLAPFNTNPASTNPLYVTQTSNTQYTALGSNNRAQSIINFNASRCNSIYGNSNTVQPPAIKVFAWKRVS